MWTYEKDNYRSFVCIPGHNYKTFETPQHARHYPARHCVGRQADADFVCSTRKELAPGLSRTGPTAPEKAAAKIVVPPDFNINLVASEPLIEKPISMDWDAQGRLWVAETPEYPFRQDRSRPAMTASPFWKRRTPRGGCSESRYFTKALDLVTSMVFYKDGVIVSQAPDVIWLRDTKGTGKADTRVVLYTGFARNDHARGH